MLLSAIQRENVWNDTATNICFLQKKLCFLIYKILNDNIFEIISECHVYAKGATMALSTLFQAWCYNDETLSTSTCADGSPLGRCKKVRYTFIDLQSSYWKFLFYCRLNHILNYNVVQKTGIKHPKWIILHNWIRKNSQNIFNWMPKSLTLIIFCNKN